jgi:ADP-ribosylglycohydrolase
MLGAIFGDIVGSVYEFNPTQDYHFPLLTEESTFTDDTICTIAIAAAYMDRRPYKDLLRLWCYGYPTPMGGYGTRFSEWLRSSNPYAYHSWGNGSAMRVSSLGWLCSSLEEVLQEATYSAACTHNHPDGIRGAQAVATAVYLARTGVGKDELLKHVRGMFLYPIPYYTDLADYRGRFDESCNGTVSAALLCIRDSHDFESAIRLAVSLGADADTLGAIVGAIAEPLYGMPLVFQEEVLKRLPEDMLDVYSQFKKSIEYGKKKT